MVSQQQFDVDLTHGAKLFCIGVNNHPFSRGGGTGGHNAAAFNQNQAQTASAVNAQLAVIAERRKVDTRFTNNFKQVAFVGELDFQTVYS